MVKSECVHSPKPSFTFYAWKRLKTVIAAVKQTNLKVKRLRGEVEEKLQARSSLTELLAEVQTKQADLVLLEDFLKREKNRMYNRNRRLTEANKSVELMEKALTRLSTEIEKDRAVYYEKMQEYVALREQLLWVNAQLMIRRKNMTGQLASIFYPQQSTSSSNCTCESVYRIAGLHLPDAENYRKHCYLEISSALGYVALLIIILSSIFDVPLSHKVKFAGSRSVIFDFSLQNSNNTIQTFPLYTSRSNKITFNYGVFLLNRNIAQFRRNLGLPTADLRCTLANVANLFEKFSGTLSDSNLINRTTRSNFPSSSTVEVRSLNRLDNFETSLASTSDDVPMMANDDRSTSLPTLLPLLSTDSERHCVLSLRPPVRIGIAKILSNRARFFVPAGWSFAAPYCLWTNRPAGQWRHKNVVKIFLFPKFLPHTGRLAAFTGGNFHNLRQQWDKRRRFYNTFAQSRHSGTAPVRFNDGRPSRRRRQIFFFFCTGPIMFGHSTGMLRWSSLLLTIVVILLYSRSTDSIRWLALGQSNKLWNHAQHCPRTRFERKRYGLAGIQTRLCKRHADLMPIIMKSASQSVMVCQQQFKNYRWNCSSVRQVPKLPPDLTKGTREQALVYALSAAAVAHGIAKACSSGTIAYCPCGNAVSGAKFDDYIRKGCSDNVPYGQKIINHMLELKCKCHGVSGSCNLKTCWKVLPPLIQIGEMLRKKYSRAAEVRWLNGGNSARYNVEPYALVGRVTEDDLVYIRKSPDYCTEDRRVGSIGTQGRTCNATEQSSAGCDSMCCGRGHEIVFEYVISNCRCRYVHCCYVECDRCRELAEKHVCK
ncbi:wnt family protein [Trichinella nativa]|uniref:Protein Wnt n=1 Tax=Trichinella nativa TaxID=6335 RepID=A0A1Y3EC26_9BILA|nr:wnt family protein [Trichinella nativa]